MNFHYEITISAIVSGILTSVFGYVLKLYLSEKIKVIVKSESDKEIEILRAEINHNISILNTVLTSQNQSFQLAQGEIYTAIKTLWSNYLIIRDSLMTINAIDSALLEDEFNALYTKNYQGNELVDKKLKMLKPFETLEKLVTVQHEIELVRPFLNEQIWLNIVYLKNFTVRLSRLYYEGSQNKNIKHWKSDPTLNGVVKSALTEKEFKFIIELKRSSVKSFQNFIEQKILFEIRKIVTGENAADNTYNYAQQLIKLMNENGSTPVYDQGVQ